MGGGGQGVWIRLCHVSISYEGGSQMARGVRGADKTLSCFSMIWGK